MAKLAETKVLPTPPLPLVMAMMRASIGAAEAGEGVTWHRSERPLGAFCRRIRLPYEVEVEKVKARGERGLLRIDLPRREASKPQRISVSAA